MANTYHQTTSVAARDYILELAAMLTEETNGVRQVKAPEAVYIAVKEAVERRREHD